MATASSLVDDKFASVKPEFRQTPDRRILYAVAQSADHDSFNDACSAAIGTLFAHVGEHNIAYAPGTFTGLCPFTGAVGDAAYVDPAWLQASVEIADDANPPTNDHVRIGVLEGGRELVGVHVGPYTTLTESWALLDEYRKQVGAELRGGVYYDVYVDDPSVGEDVMRTELHFPVQ